MVHYIIEITFFPKKKDWQSFDNLVDVSLSEEVGSLVFYFEMYKFSNSKLLDVEHKRKVICPN